MLKITLKSIKHTLFLFSLIIAFSCSEEPVEGTDGVDGTNGFNALVIVDDEAPGESCSTGGVKISVGQDANENGALDADEVASVSFVCNGSAGTDGSSGPTLFARTSPEEPGENCDAGGTLVEIGADINGNALLDDDEVQTSFFVCNGSDGADGGSGGESGLTSLIRATPLEECGPNNTTGVRIEIGLDVNGNGSLDSDPDEVQSTYEICDGKDGADGASGDNGMNALIGISTFDGDQNGCSNGGIRIAAGLDISDDGVLQGGEEMNVEFICNGQNGNDGASGSDGKSVVVTINEDPRDCSNGGIEIVLEYDNDGDGVGDEALGSYAICNGADGATGPAGDDGVGLLIQKSAEPAGSNCPSGGTFVEIFRDEDGDGMINDGPAEISFYVCDGNNSLVDVSTFIGNAGTCNTNDGGIRIDVGVDDNGDGVLQPSEIDDTQYICNGDDGANGQDGNSDGVYEFYFTEGFDEYSGMLDATIYEPSNGSDAGILRVYSTFDGESRQLQSVSLLYFPGIDGISEIINDDFYITEAILYVRGFTTAENGNDADNWIGVKAIRPGVDQFDETATWTSPNIGSSLWSDGKGFSDQDTYEFSDLYRLPSSFEFSGTIPLLVDKSRIDDWILDPEKNNKGLALELGDQTVNRNFTIDIYSSEYNTDVNYRPTLYIKAKVGKKATRGRLVEDEFKARWNTMGYEEKLAPLRNRD